MRLLDLFCGAGGAAMGYVQAGFDVVGVDIRAQPGYPFQFVQADAVEYLNRFGAEFDAIHASPPCQCYTNAQRIQQRTHPDLIAPLRDRLQQLGKPYVIENVVGAPLLSPILLCGLPFGLHTYRHRLFETSFAARSLLHQDHVRPQVKMGRPPAPHQFIQVVGNFSDVRRARQAMGISWMTRDELREAIPPAYTEYIGRQLIVHTGGHLPIAWN